MFISSKLQSSLALAVALGAAASSRAAVTGQWDFKSGNLNATTGQPLEFLDGPGGATEQQTVFGTTSSLGLPDIGGQPAHVMGFPRSLPAMGYLMHSNMDPNGGGGMVNQYTLIFDLLYTNLTGSGWRALTQIDDPSNASDADFFINPAGGIGISGSYQGVVTTNAWHRIAIAVDLADPAGPLVRKYIDGAFAGQQVLGAGVDGRWAISPTGSQFGDAVLLFTDNDADGASEAPGYVSSIQVHDTALSGAYIAALGAPAGDQIPATVQVPVSIVSRQPATNAVNVMPGASVDVTLQLGSETFDPATIALKLNGQPLSATVTPQDQQFAIHATLPNDLASKSTNTLQLLWSDPARGGSVTQQWTFSVAPYTLDPALAASLAKGVTAYWKLDEGLTNVNETVLQDIARGNDSTLASSAPDAAWRTGTDAKFGSALYLDENATVDVSTNDTMNIKTNQVTISAWVKLDQLPSELSETFGSIFDSVEDDYVLYLDKNNRELRFKVTDDTTAAARPGIPESQLRTGEWMNVIAVYNGKASTNAGDARIYLNGQLADVHVGSDASVGSGLTGNVRAGQVAAMGRNGAQAQSYLHGAVDDVAIWSRALSLDEIGYLASGHAVPVSGPLTVPASVSSRFPAQNAMNVLPGTDLVFVLSQGSATINSNTITVTINGQNVPATITSEAGAITVRATIGNYPSRSANTVRVQWNDPAVGGVVTDQWTFTMAAYGDDPQIAAALQNGLFAYWTFDEGLTNPAATTLTDSAGDFDATLTVLSPDTAWLTNGAAKFGSALFLDENTYAELPAAPAMDITNRQVSISAWVNLSLLPSQLPEGFGSIFDSVEDDYVLYLDRGNKELRFKVTDASNQAARPGIPEARLTTNVWLHVAAVFDGGFSATAGQARIYLNGQLAKANTGNDGSGGLGLTNVVRAGQNAAMGKNGVQAISVPHAGVDDLAIWTRALTADEIGYLAAGHAVKGAASTTVQITNISLEGQTVHITWAGKPGNYQLQRRASLTSGTWENAGTAGTATQAQDTVTGQSMFYRVVAQ